MRWGRGLVGVQAEVTTLFTTPGYLDVQLLGATPLFSKEGLGPVPRGGVHIIFSW